MLKSVKHTTRILVILSLGLFMAGCTTTSTSSLSSSGGISSGRSTAEMPPLLRTRLDAAAEYLRKGNHRGARDHLKKAQEMDRREPEVYDLLALLYYRELEFELAEKNYRQAIAVDRNFTRGYNNYGSFLYARQRYEEACGYLETASTDVDYSLRASVFGKLGKCYLKREQVAEAKQAFIKVSALNPRMAEPYLELADILFQEKQYPEAKQYWNYYNRLKQRSSARGLWLGVRLEHVFENKDARDSHGLALSKLYPDSQESLDYKSWLRNDYLDSNP